eukprot:4770933-Amphidinium_carterae.1
MISRIVLLAPEDLLTSEYSAWMSDAQQAAKMLKDVVHNTVAETGSIVNLAGAKLLHRAFGLFRGFMSL